MDKKVLITGSNGLLGQALVKLYLDKGEFQVHGCGRGPNKLNLENFSYHSLDLTDWDALKAVLNQGPFDAIINTAAMTNVDQCESEHEACRAINVGVPEFIVNNIPESTHFIHISTDFVFDGTAGPYSENDVPNPLSFYAKSKYDSEQAVLKSDHKKSTIGRTMIVYGTGEDLSRNNIVMWAIGELLSGNELNIVNDQYRSPSWANDLAMACFLIHQKGKLGLYHLSGSETFSMFELVQNIAEYLGVDKALINPITSDALNRPAPRPMVTGFVIDKAVNELGYKPHTLNEVLSIIAPQKKNS